MPRSKHQDPAVLYFPNEIQKKLSQIKNYPLSILEAPSGYGKTTALRHLLESRGWDTIPRHWHTFLGERIVDSWNIFCGMIGKFDPDNAEALLSGGPPTEDNIQLMAEIFTCLNSPCETFLVLDSFENIKLPDILLFLKLLSMHGGCNLHIIAVTRQLPDADTGIIVGSRLIYRMKASDFTFSKADTGAYYQKAGLALTGTQLLEVYDKTEGWVLALFLQMRSFISTGAFDSEDMGELMHHALWLALTPAQQYFFLAVSIFSRFTMSQAIHLADMISEKIDAEQLEYLLRENACFVHFDREDYCFFLHTTFAEFLHRNFSLLSEEKKREIYLAGGEIARQAGDRLNTLKFFYCANAYEQIFALPLTSYELADIVDEITKPMILDVLDNTPIDVKVKYPAAIIPLAFTLFFLGENEKLMAMQDEIEIIIGKSALDIEKKNALRGEIELLLSFLEYNRIDDMSRHHRKALSLLGGPATLISVKSTWTFGSPSVLYMYWRESGKLSGELSQMDECMPYYYKLTKGHGSGAEIIMRAEAEFLKGRPENAEILCHQAMFTADMKKQNSIYQCGLFLLMRIALLRGDKSLAETTMQNFTERSRQNTEDLCRCTLDLAQGFYGMLTGRESMIPPWLSEGDISEKRLVIMTQPFAHIIYGRILLSRKEYQKLLGVGAYVMGISSIFPTLLPQVYWNIYMAQALHALGKPKDAVKALENALSMALPDQIYMPFAENAEGLKKLLPHVGKEMEEAGMKRISELSGELLTGLKQFIVKAPELSPREQDVLNLIRDHLNNKQIAERLHISVSTVKMTVRHIFEKTGVHSRELLK